MKKNTLTLAVALLTVLGSFQDAHAMGGARKLAQGLFRTKTTLSSTEKARIQAERDFEKILLYVALASAKPLSAKDWAQIITLSVGSAAALSYTLNYFLNKPTPQRKPHDTSAEQALRELPIIKTEEQLEAQRQGVDIAPTNLKEQIRSLYTEEDFAFCVKRNALGFPVMVNRDEFSSRPLVKGILEDIEKDGTVTLSPNDSTITLSKEHRYDVTSTFLDELEKYLTKVQKESDALEVQVQKQVLGLEGVTK